MISTFGWQWMFYLGGLPLLTIPFILKTLPDSINHYVRNENKEQVAVVLQKIEPSYIASEKDEFELEQGNVSGVPVSELFKEKRTRSTIAFWVSTFMLLLMVYGLGTWLPQLMVEAGYALESSLMFLLALNIGAMFGQVGGGLLADRNGSKKILIMMFLIGGIALLLFGLSFNAVILYLLAAIAGSCTLENQEVLRVQTIAKEN
ncbi:MFS transporter [Butyricicoccus sp. 1XD8-22]|nr:MFS transporter [Butyricicoccus sp. 1XD8-22]